MVVQKQMFMAEASRLFHEVEQIVGSNRRASAQLLLSKAKEALRQRSDALDVGDADLAFESIQRLRLHRELADALDDGIGRDRTQEGV